MQNRFFLAFMTKQKLRFPVRRTLGHALLSAEPVHMRLRPARAAGRRIIRIQHRAVGFRLILEDARFGAAIRFSV